MSGRLHTRKRIGDMLVEAGLVSGDMVEEALTIQKEKGGKIVQILVSLGCVTVDDFVNFLSRQPGIASIDLANYHVQTNLLCLVPREAAMKHEVFPIDKMGKLLTLGMVCPLDYDAIAEIEEKSALRVKPILCSPRDISSAINLYYSKDFSDSSTQSIEALLEEDDAPVSTAKARAGIKVEQVSSLIRDLDCLPALPDTVERVHEAAEDIGMAPKQVADIISSDPPISAKVLSVANSAAYGFPSQVGSIDLAVALLGLRETYAVVLSAAVMDLFDTNKRFNYRVFWGEAMNGGAAARLIAKACAAECSSSVFSAALLRDLGRMALLEAAPELYASINPKLDGQELIEAEQKALGISHTEAGYELAYHWNLPKEISIPIRFHHDPDGAESFQQETAIVALAELWTRRSNGEQPEKEQVMEETAKLTSFIGMNESVASVTYDLVASLERVRFSWSAEESAATA